MAFPSFPDVHVTGVIHHYVKIPGDSDAYYLGTAEVTPQILRKRYYQPVFNDIAGKTLPFQKTYDGEAANVSAVLTRFGRLPWERLATTGSNAGLIVPAEAPGILLASGTESRWSRGHLVFGQSSFELWQVFENAFNPLLPTALEMGIYWPQVTLEEHTTEAAGTQAEKLRLLFDCQPYWIPQNSISTVNNASNERGWLLYSNDDSFFPISVQVPQ